VHNNTPHSNTCRDGVPKLEMLRRRFFEV